MLFRSQALSSPPEQVTGLNGQIVLNYSSSDKNSLAWIYTIQGNGLTGQGLSKPFSFSSLTYSHIFSPKLTLTLDVQNLFGRPLTRQTSKAPGLMTQTESRSEGRVIMLTLRRSFVRFAP